jgi:hypothetical protein
MPTFMRYLQKQWMWPVLALVPIGLLRIRVWSSSFFAFLLLGLAGVTVFAVGYDIPDPEGFYMPIATLLALAIGAALSDLPFRGWALVTAWSALAACVGATATTHVIEWANRNGYELVDSIGDGRKFILWDLDDLFARIPEGASFAVPCDHYGCIEVVDYYRFADPVPARRKIRFVRLPGIEAALWSVPTTPVDAIDFERARAVVVCSLRSGDAMQMRRRGITVTAIERAPKQVRGGALAGIPIYCSVPGASQPATISPARR